MPDFYFDFELWLAWTNFNFWSISILGFVSALLAYNNYNYYNSKNTSAFAFMVLLAMLFMLGLFPIEWGYATDRANYAQEFISIQHNDTILRTGDTGFVLLTRLLSKFLDVKGYMLAITIIYLSNYYISIAKLTCSRSYWLVVAVVLSMGFTSYAINTMRAGIALSFIILGLSMYPNKWKMLICLFVASTLHASATIPSLMIIIAYFFPKTKLFYKLWFLSIPLSFVAGSMFMNLFAGMSEDNRVHYLTNIVNSNYNVGFRIDFVIYSLVPIFIGGYYIFKKKFNNDLYSLIYNAYILSNIFWILVIRADYSDRFAYLSWFLIPFVLVYPLLKQKMEIKENIWLGLILLGETTFKFLI